MICFASDDIHIQKYFWEELIGYFPLIQHGPYRKQEKLGDTGTEEKTARFQAMIRGTHRQ
jgi:hypothetical protein